MSSEPGNTDMTGMKHSLTQQIAEVELELSYRASVYPRLVAQRKMRQAEADMRVDIMRAVKETLERLRDSQ